MPKFREKPVVVEAFRLGEKGQSTPAPAWFGSPPASRITPEGVVIPTREGNTIARWGDWIVNGVGGEVSCFKPDVFDATYELITDH